MLVTKMKNKPKLNPTLTLSQQRYTYCDNVRTVLCCCLFFVYVSVRLFSSVTIYAHNGSTVPAGQVDLIYGHKSLSEDSNVVCCCFFVHFHMMVFTMWDCSHSDTETAMRPHTLGPHSHTSRGVARIF